MKEKKNENEKKKEMKQMIYDTYTIVRFVFAFFCLHDFIPREKGFVYNASHIFKKR